MNFALSLPILNLTENDFVERASESAHAVEVNYKTTSCGTAVVKARRKIHQNNASPFHP